jgi:hypothetical protein
MEKLSRTQSKHYQTPTNQILFESKPLQYLTFTEPAANMSTPVPAAPTNLPELTYRDLALQAATATNLNSFSAAYDPNPNHAERLAATFSKEYPDTSRLANFCDSGLTKQFAFLIEPTTHEDPPNATLAVLSCPFPTVTTATNEPIFAGTLGDRMDIICPVTVRMRDVRGSVITITPTDAMTIKLNLATSPNNPITEEGPAPDDPEAESEQPGPDRVFIEVTNPNDKPCFIRIPKVFPLPGGYSIPTSTQPIKTASTNSLEPLFTAQQLENQENQTNNPTDELLFWYEAMRYGITNLKNYSIHAKDTLFTYESINKDQFIPETNLTSRFTIAVSYLTPNDPMYQQVINHVLAEKEKATTAFGSRIHHKYRTANAFTTPPKLFDNHFQHTQPTDSISPTSDVRAILEGLTAALTESSSKTMTGTEREQAKEAADVKAFYEILFATIIESTDNQGVTHKKFIKANINPGFEEVLKANKNSKATKLLQSAVESTASEIETTHDNRFASACNLVPTLFDQPMTAAIRTGQWEYQHTVLHPEGITTHFGLHHIASPRTRSAFYKTRIEGATKIIQQEHVDEDKTKTAAKATDLYHYGRMGNINELHELIGNFYCLMHTMITVDSTAYPAIWLEITYFDKILRSTEGRKWFELHFYIKELLFNVVQEIQSTIAGFVSIARKQGYKTALTKNFTIAGEIFDLAQHQGIELRRNLQGTILTMQAGPYKEASIVFKQFYPDNSTTDNNRKRNSPNNQSSNSNENNGRNQRPTPNDRSSPPTEPNNRNTSTQPNRNNATQSGHQQTAQRPPSQPGTQAVPGKTILKFVNENSTDPPIHPGPIFPHPHKANRFTLMCNRSAYEGKACTYNPCNFYHFPNNLATVSPDLKTKLTNWVGNEPSITWASSTITNWATQSAGNSSRN